jgi:L-amino acid N-acyltransferase YncA
VAVRDGGHVLIRPLLAQDRPGVVSFLAGLSPESRAQRFHSSSMPITPGVIDLATGGHALVATRHGAIVALASFHPQSDLVQAELAIVVADAEQRRGIGTALAQRLVRDAAGAGIHRLQAEVASSNRGVLALLRALGLPMVRHAHGLGLMTVDVELCPAPAPPLSAQSRSGAA